MSNEEANKPSTYEEINSILKRDPEVHACAHALQKAIGDYDETQKFILTEREKGIQVPNLQERTHTIQRNLCVALDKMALACEACEDPQIVNIAIGIHQHGVMYFNAFFTSIHYSRMVTTHTDARPYERLMHEAYALFERAQKKASQGAFTV